jgi:hypothetical protein
VGIECEDRAVSGDGVTRRGILAAAAGAIAIAIGGYDMLARLDRRSGGGVL